MDKQTSYELALISGNLTTLSSDERLSFYKKVCDSLGLNPLTKPFEYLQLNGKLVLYATRACTEQLRQIHKVSIQILSRDKVGTCYQVVAKATLPDGRFDEALGVVSITRNGKTLEGDDLANALMKADTKAKRRVTLSICGLGMLDETEIETIKDAKKVEPETIKQETKQLPNKAENVITKRVETPIKSTNLTNKGPERDKSFIDVLKNDPILGSYKSDFSGPRKMFENKLLIECNPDAIWSMVQYLDKDPKSNEKKDRFITNAKLFLGAINFFDDKSIKEPENPIVNNLESVNKMPTDEVPFPTEDEIPF